MQLLPTCSPDFWANLWQEAQNNSPVRNRRRRTEAEMIEFWNRRASEFAQLTHKHRGEQRRQTVLNFLKHEGALQRGFTVLDIGAGPGNYTIPIAQMASQVTALEPASEMANILQQRAEQENLKNIRIIQRTWQEVDVASESLVGQYDLVFASMTPGVQDPETLKKMIKASQGYCYLSGFSGCRWNKAQRDLWQRFFNEDIGENPGDIIYPFGMLYSMGYRPNLRFHTHQRVDEQPVEIAAANILKFFENYMNISTDTKKEIEDYVAKHAENGTFRQEHNGCSGMMVWRVNDTESG